MTVMTKHEEALIHAFNVEMGQQQMIFLATLTNAKGIIAKKHYINREAMLGTFDAIFKEKLTDLLDITN